MTPREQAMLLVQALNRVLVELDAVAVGSLEALDPATLSHNSGLESQKDPPIPHVGTISFVPDEGSTAPAISIDVIRNSQRRGDPQRARSRDRFMTRIDDLISVLTNTVGDRTVSYNSASAAWDVYEGYAFGLVIQAAIAAGGRVRYEDRFKTR